MSEITEEITYTLGRLAGKLGISKTRLMNHLRDTGLIEQCRLTKGGHWRIPYSLAVRISSAEALSIPEPTPLISRQTGAHNNRGKVSTGQRSFVNEPKPVKDLMVSIPNYAQIGISLQRAGITMADLVKYFGQSVEATYEQQPQNNEKRQNNSAKRDENQRDATTSGSANSDISNSSAK